MDQITIISLFVLLFALALPALSQALARHPGVLTATKYFIFAVYVLANLYETILFRTVQPQPMMKLEPLWSYRQSLALDGGLWGAVSGFFTGTGGVYITDPGLLEEIILNILLYVPLGYLLPFTWPKLEGRLPGDAPRSGKRLLSLISWKAVGIGLVCSTLTELTQLIFKIGLFELDDIINNTLGCLFGALLYVLIKRREEKRRSNKRTI